jgi:hypothetical protein
MFILTQLTGIPELFDVDTKRLEYVSLDVLSPSVDCHVNYYFKYTHGKLKAY